MTIRDIFELLPNPRDNHIFLFLLSKCNEDGQIDLTLAQIGKALGIPTSTTAVSVNRLIEKGLLFPRLYPNRKNGLHLTISNIATYKGFFFPIVIPERKEDEERAKEENKKEENPLSPTPPTPKEEINKEEREKEAEEKESHDNYYYTTHARERDPWDMPLNTPVSTSPECSSEPPTPLDREMQTLSCDQIWQEAICMREVITIDFLTNIAIPAFRLECIAQGRLSHPTMRDLKQHFSNWIRIFIAKQKQKANEQHTIITHEDIRRMEREQRMQEYAAVAAEFAAEADRNFRSLQE